MGPLRPVSSFAVGWSRQRTFSGPLSEIPGHRAPGPAELAGPGDVSGGETGGGLRRDLAAVEVQPSQLAHLSQAEQREAPGVLPCSLRCCTSMTARASGRVPPGRGRPRGSSCSPEPDRVPFNDGPKPLRRVAVRDVPSCLGEVLPRDLLESLGRARAYVPQASARSTSPWSSSSQRRNP